MATLRDETDAQYHKAIMEYQLHALILILKIYLFYTGVQLIYHVVLVSGIQDSDSVIHTCISQYFFRILFSYVLSRSVMFDSFCSHGLQPARLLCSWNPPGKNTGVCCHSLLQGIFLTQGQNLGLLHCRQILYHLSFISCPNSYAEAIRSDAFPSNIFHSGPAWHGDL